jgi:hypothetical protein
LSNPIRSTMRMDLREAKQAENITSYYQTGFCTVVQAAQSPLQRTAFLFWYSVRNTMVDTIERTVAPISTTLNNL